MGFRQYWVPDLVSVSGLIQTIFGHVVSSYPDHHVSMSGKGDCYDNAVVETFFKTLKAELIWRHTWHTRRQVEGALFQYISGFYNLRRRHSTLAGKSPLAFEQKAA